MHSILHYRYGHANIRTNSESLAFCGHQAAQFELEQQDQKLNKVCQAQFDVFKAQFLLEMATNANSYLSSIASFLIIALPIFSGTYDFLDQPELGTIHKPFGQYLGGFTDFRLSWIHFDTLRDVP